jgi:two-component system response regulator CssR
MLPLGNGYDFCKEVFEKIPEIPVIMLSAVRQSEEDKILGLESGAIDYVLKSYSHKELLARIKRQ